MATKAETKTLLKITVYSNFHPDDDDEYIVQLWVPNWIEDEEEFIEAWMIDHLKNVDQWEFAD